MPGLGGIKGGLGLAEDRAEASIACRQVGPIRMSDELEDGEVVFKERTSLVFKTMQVVRFFDEARNTLVYLVYSDRVIEGSPQNAVTAIPILPWTSNPQSQIKVRRSTGFSPVRIFPAPSPFVGKDWGEG